MDLTTIPYLRKAPATGLLGAGLQKEQRKALFDALFQRSWGATLRRLCLGDGPTALVPGSATPPWRPREPPFSGRKKKLLAKRKEKIGAPFDKALILSPKPPFGRGFFAEDPCPPLRPPKGFFFCHLLKGRHGQKPLTLGEGRKNSGNILLQKSLRACPSHRRRPGARWPDAKALSHQRQKSRDRSRALENHPREGQKLLGDFPCPPGKGKKGEPEEGGDNGKKAQGGKKCPE